MELHKDSGSLRVIIDVSYESADEFIDFIENEQCQFIESLGVDGLKLNGMLMRKQIPLH